MPETLHKTIIIVLSLLVPLTVALLFFIKIPADSLGIDMRFFPGFHAFLNSLTSLFLIAGFFFIRNKNISAHKLCMMISIALSVIFLMSYLFYHSVAESARFGGEGPLRMIYFFILITHIILAAGVLPFILITFSRALLSQFSRHKKIARWTLPVWLYVTITGVVVYLMMIPYY